jgi:hypothetical protein
MCSAFPQETKTRAVSHSGGLAKFYVQSMMDKTRQDKWLFCVVSLFLELFTTNVLIKKRKEKQKLPCPCFE